MIYFKIDVPKALKEAGYTTYEMQKNKLLSSSTIHKLHKGITSLTMNSVDAICTLLKCQPGDIIGWQEDTPEENQEVDGE